MDVLAVMAFNLIQKIDDEFKQFTGNRHAFACKVLQQHGIKVDFIKTPAGVFVTVDYDDIIELFTKSPAHQSTYQGHIYAAWN